MLVAQHDFTIANTPLPPWIRQLPGNPGWLYILKSGSLFKIGKTTSPKRRFRQAQTWLPDGELIGMKPFWYIHVFERTLLCGIANFWHEGEWHQFPDETWSDFLVSGFRMFDDHDRNKNTADFHYWIAGSGMSEVIAEQNHRRISLRRWQREA
jgi:hypothetical protein